MDAGTIGLLPRRGPGVPRREASARLGFGEWRRLRVAAEQVMAGVHDPVPTLLDLGCGPGLSTRELLRVARHRGLTPRIIGVDASRAMVDHARAGKWPQGVEFVQGSLQHLEPLRLPRAHGALVRAVPSDVDDLDAVLVGLRAMLAPGARVVAAGPATALAGPMVAAGFTVISSRRRRPDTLRLVLASA